MTTDLVLVGSYNFKVAVSLDTTYPITQFSDDSMTFKVQVHCAIINLRPVITD